VFKVGFRTAAPKQLSKFTAKPIKKFYLHVVERFKGGQLKNADGIVVGAYNGSNQQVFGRTLS